MWENLGVAVIILIALFFTVKSLARTLTGKKCNCSQGNCPYANKCHQDDHQP